MLDVLRGLVVVEMVGPSKELQTLLTAGACNKSVFVDALINGCSFSVLEDSPVGFCFLHHTPNGLEWQQHSHIVNHMSSSSDPHAASAMPS